MNLKHINSDVTINPPSQYLHIDIPTSLLEQIDQFQCDMHLYHRANAIRYLLQTALLIETSKRLHHAH